MKSETTPLGLQNLWPHASLALKDSEDGNRDDDLEPEIQTGLLAMAEATGMSPEQYIATMVENTVRPRSLMNPGERAAAWIESARRLPITPPLSDEAISRESTYADRG